MVDVPMPSTLRVRGKRLWEQVTGEHTLDPVGFVLLEEACRAADTLDTLDRQRRRGGERGDLAMKEARQQQNVLKQLLVSLRLPDSEGVRPQRRGSRGSYDTSGGAPRVVMESALDRARNRAV